MPIGDPNNQPVGDPKRNVGRDAFERATQQMTLSPEVDTGNASRDVFERNTRQEDPNFVDFVIKHQLDVQRYVEPKIVMQAYREAGAFDLNYDEIVDGEDPIVRAEQQHRAEAWQRDYVTQFEDAWATYRGRIPDTFFYQFDFEDLLMLPATVPPEVMEDMAWLEEQKARERMLQQQIETRTEEILRSSKAGDRAGDYFSGLFTGNLVKAFGEGVLGLNQDDVTEAQRLEMARKQAEDEIFGRSQTTGSNFWGTAWDLAQTGWNSAYNDTFILGHTLRGGGAAVSWLGNVLASASGSVIRGVDMAGNALFDQTTVEERWEVERDQEIANLQEQMGNPDEMLTALTWQEGRRAWDQLTEQEKSLWIEQHGGSEIQAMGFFIDEHAKDPDVEQQMQQYVEQLTEAQREQIKQLEEGHFENKTAAMSALSAWGEITEDLAIGATLLAFDDLARSKAMDLKISEFMKEIRDVEKGPSEVLGWDGTALGVVYDLGAMGVMDPLNYVFGTGMASAIGRGVARTSTQVARKIASPGVQSLMKNVAHGIASGSRSTVGMVTAAGLDSVGQLQMMQLVRSRAQNLKQLWRASYPQAAEIAVEKIAGLIPTELIDDAKKATAAIKNRGGLKRPVELIMDSKGNVAINRYDVSAVRAVMNLGEEFVPVRVRRLDDVVRAGYSDDTIRRMEEVRAMPAGAENDDLIEALIPNAQLRHNQLRSYQVGTHTLDSGETLTLRTVLEEGDNAGTYYFTNAADEVVAVVKGGDFGGGLGVLEGYRGNGLTKRIFEMAHDFGDDLIHTVDMSTISPKGKGALESYIRSVLDDPEALSQLDEVVEVFNGNQMWGKSFNVPEEIGSNLSPMSAFDDSFVIDPSTLKEVEKIFTGSLMRTGRLKGVEQAAISRGMRSMVENITKIPLAEKPVNWLKRLFTQHNLTTSLNLSRLNGTGEAIEFTLRMWGDDTANAEIWLSKLSDAMYGKRANKVLASKLSDDIVGLEAEMKVISDQVGGNPYGSPSDKVVREALENAPEEYAGTYAAMSELRKQAKDLAKQLRQKRTQQMELLKETPSYDDVYQLLDEMVDDFNRQHIASKKYWKEFVDPETGLVPRDLLAKGMRRGDEIKPGYVEDFASFAEIAGVDVKEMNKLYRQVRGDVHKGFEFGVSPLDLAVAAEWGGARYTQFTHLRTVHRIRETMNTVINVWMTDKVFRPATAAVVSIDEQMRILHLYGQQALRRWIDDKAISLAARVNNQFMHPKRLGVALLEKNAPIKGVKNLSPAAQERIRALEDFPDRLKQAERSFYDQHGIGWTDVLPDDPEYLDHAIRWSNQFIENPMFRSFLNGRDDFARWWNSADGVEAQARMQSVAAGRGGKLTSKTPTMDEVYKGWETMWDVMTSNVPKGELADWTNAWKEAARRTAETGRPHSLPGHLFDDGKFIPVRGAQKTQKSGLFGEWTEKFFDRLFMDPVQYRRGFIAEMVRQTERKRLTQLYASQGRAIVPDSQLATKLRKAGYVIPDNYEGQQLIHRLWVDSPFVPESFVNEIIEDAVVSEIENVLYKWNMGSRAGAMVKPIFPFGKPYADMAAFWGRETLKQPVLRGYLTQDNFLNMESLAKLMPFNPRPAAMVSRLAATDMKINKGWIPFDNEENEGLLPGSTESDISPLFFLPTEGEDIIGATLPGMGYLPLIALDMVLNTVGPDPVEEPLEYQQWIDNLSYALPYFEYQQGGSLSRIFGGGTFATSFSLGADILGFNTGQTFYNVTSELGDIGREIRRNRELGVLLSDPQVLDDLGKIEDEEDLELFLNGLVDSANKAASESHGLESFGRFAIPVRSRYDVTSAELQDVWINASEQFPDVLGIETFDPNNKDDKRQAAADIRTRFFDLEGDQRDLLVAAYPQLAVNLVSSWEWTPKGVNAGFPGTSLPYSSGGAPSDLVRHDYYVTNGFVRPIQPAHRARLIIGQVAQARDSVIKNVYETVATDINDFVWEEIVSQNDDAMSFLTALQEDFGEAYGTADVRQFWQHFYSLEELVAKDAELVDEDGEPVGSLGFPQDMKPWSTSWPGFEEASKKFNSVTLTELPESVQQAVEIMGLEVTEGMTGEQFHRALADELATNQALAYGVYEANWRAYGQERLAFSQSGDLQLTKAMYNTEFDEEFKKSIRNWNLQVEMAREEWSDSPKGIPAAVRQELVNGYNEIVHGAKDKNNSVPWDFIWDSKFKGSLGPRDWTPPEPAPVYIDGVKNANAIAPYIHDIVDGDSIVFSEEPGGDLFEVRLLGVDSREFATDRTGALEDTERLEDFVERARENGDTIYLVRDPERYATNTDRYGRMLAWLWAGDEAFYFVDEMNPKFTPSGGSK